MSDFIDLPATSEDVKTMPIGIHRMTIIKMEKAVDKNNQPILDNRNYPAIRIHFKNVAGDIIESIFHYSSKPENDPVRTNPDLMCKSEFRLNNLKKAMGFGPGPVKADSIKGKWFWGMVYGEQLTHEENGQPVLRDSKDPNSKITFFRLGSYFWPYNPTMDGAKLISDNRPVKEGDPNNPASNGVPSGDFIRPKKMKISEVQKFLEKSGDKKPASDKQPNDFGENPGPSAQAGPTPESPVHEEESAAADLPSAPQNDDW